MDSSRLSIGKLGGRKDRLFNAAPCCTHIRSQVICFHEVLSILRFWVHQTVTAWIKTWGSVGLLYWSDATLSCLRRCYLFSIVSCTLNQRVFNNLGVTNSYDAFTGSPFYGSLRLKLLMNRPFYYVRNASKLTLGLQLNLESLKIKRDGNCHRTRWNQHNRRKLWWTGHDHDLLHRLG